MVIKFQKIVIYSYWSIEVEGMRLGVSVVCMGDEKKVGGKI